MAAENTFVEPASAKVNLFLHVTGRRQDGYHLLDSLVVFADVGDRVSASPADGISLSYDGPYADDLPPPQNNLVLRAAAQLRDTLGIAEGAALILTKELPVASGIGGGSADAAAALRVLCRLWRVNPDNPAIGKIAPGLGADVPVCLAGRTARMQGIGEYLSFIGDLPTFWMVLVNPGVAVSTPTVFKARVGAFSDPAAWPAHISSVEELADALGITSNDLQSPAIGLAPQIDQVLDALQATSGTLLARMSGSGATCFALMADEAAASAAARELAVSFPKWWVCAAQAS